MFRLFFQVSFCFLFLTTCALAAPDSKSSEGVKITVNKSKQGIKRSVDTNITIPQSAEASVFQVGNPERIVVDILHAQTKKNSTIAVPGKSAISQIRVGSHAEKVRVVLDLRQNTTPVYTWKRSGNVITVSVEEPEEVRASQPSIAPTVSPTKTAKEIPSPSPRATAIVIHQDTPIVEASASETTKVPAALPTEIMPEASPTVADTATSQPSKIPTIEPSQTSAPPTKTAKPTKTPKPTSTPRPSPTSKPPTAAPTLPPPTIAPTNTAAITPPTVKAVASAAATVDASSNSSTSQTAPMVFDATGSWVLKELIFDHLDPGRIPLLKVMLSRPKARAQITKIDPKTYRIIIGECSLAGQHLTLPQFPPADFSGINLITTKQEAGTCQVTITVESGISLGTFVRGSEIWVKKL